MNVNCVSVLGEQFNKATSGLNISQMYISDAVVGTHTNTTQDNTFETGWWPIDQYPSEPYFQHLTPWVPPLTTWTGTGTNISVSVVPIDSESIVETKEKWSLRLDIPGVVLSDLSISIDNFVLKIDARRADTKKSTSREFQIPRTSNLKQISASLKNGVLMLEIKQRKSKSVKVVVR